MQLPFTADQFFDVFRRYNEAVWPMQWLLLILGMAAIIATAIGAPRFRRVPAFVLAFLWLWMAVVYHWVFFQKINPAAALFGLLFLIQALILLWSSRSRTGGIATTGVGATLAGAVMMLYALVIYPALGFVAGHRYPAAPTFGLPCPTTIFTLGLILFTRQQWSPVVLVVPALWAVVATSAALQLGMTEDLALPIAALTAIALWPRRKAVSLPGVDQGTVALQTGKPR